MRLKQREKREKMTLMIVAYAFPKSESEDEMGKKYIRNQSLKLPLRLKKKQ